MRKATKSELKVRGKSVAVSKARHVKTAAESEASGTLRNQGKPPPHYCTIILVKNLPYEFSKTEIRSLFRSCGTIGAIRPLAPTATSKSSTGKGVAFVEFSGPKARQSVINALGMHGTKVAGREIKVDWSQESSKFVKIQASKARQNAKKHGHKHFAEFRGPSD